MPFREDLITESRWKSAIDKKQTPLKLYPESQSGIFASSDGGFYETTLDNCSCPDFAIQGHLQPCKHMIRLAMECGVIDNSDMQTDRGSALVKYHLGFFREYIHNNSFIEIIPSAKLFIFAANGNAVLEPSAFEKSMDLPHISDCPLFVSNKNGTVSMNKKYIKDAQSIINLLKRIIGDEAIARIWDDTFLETFMKTEAKIWLP